MVSPIATPIHLMMCNSGSTMLAARENMRGSAYYCQLAYVPANLIILYPDNEAPPSSWVELEQLSGSRI